jgi:hypothetical protein
VADVAELEYGTVEVSNEYRKAATLKNKSKILAEYTAFTK